jgi:hypothetical protein
MNSSYGKSTWSASSTVSPRHRQHSEINLIVATHRDFDLKAKLNIYDRKLAQQLKNEERMLLRSQKWKYKVEKNNVLKDVNNPKSNTNNLTPSVDDWLKMNIRTKHMVLSSSDLSK